MIRRREEGELSDTDEVMRLQEQMWWKEREEDKGGQLTHMPLVCYRRIKPERRWRDGGCNGRMVENWPRDRLRRVPP